MSKIPRVATSPHHELAVVINADDLGGDGAINAAIFDALSRSVVSSTTIMANGPAFTEAVRQATLFPRVSFGVHLNLTDFSPLSRQEALRPLLDENGVFRGEAFLGQVSWTGGLLRAVVEEWKAQVRRVLDAGVKVTHLDSHNHVHTIPALFPALKAVQYHLGLRRVRGTRSIYERSRKPGRGLRVKKWAWLTALRYCYATRTTDEFADFLMFLKAVEEGTYRPRTWPRTIELMVHPNGNPSESGHEAEVLRSPWHSTIPCNVKLISYTQV